MIYRCQYFKLEELVPPETFNQVFDPSRLWIVFDPLALWTLDNLRDRYGPLIVNTWSRGLRYGGYRPLDCSIGAKWSQHKFGRAFDPKSSTVTADEMRKDILDMSFQKRQSVGLDHINRVEMSVNWFHFDTGNSVGQNIFTF